MSVSPRRPKLPAAAYGGGPALRLDDMSRQLNHALCNFAVVEDKLRTEQELGKAFYLLKQEKAELLRTKLRHDQDGHHRSKLEEKLHLQEVDHQHTQQQLLAMRQRVVAVEAERDFIRAQATDFTAYWKEIETVWASKEAEFATTIRRGELDLAQVEMSLMDTRGSLEGAIRAERLAMEEVATTRESLTTALDTNRRLNVELAAQRDANGTLAHHQQLRDAELYELHAQHSSLLQKVDALLAHGKQHAAAEDTLQAQLMEQKRKVELKEQAIATEGMKNAAAQREIAILRRDLEEKHRETETLVSEVEAREAAAREAKATEESLRRTLVAKCEEIKGHLEAMSERKRTIGELEDTNRDREKRIETLSGTVASLEAATEELSTELGNTQARCNQLTLSKETLQRELAVAKKEAKASEEALHASNTLNSELQQKVEHAQHAVAAARTDATSVKSKADRSADALERDMRTLTADLQRRGDDVKLLDERLRTAQDARLAAEAVVAHHEETIRAMQEERSTVEAKGRHEAARLLDRLQRQSMAMDALAADLPTVEQSRRRILDAQRQMAEAQQQRAAEALAQASSPPRESRRAAAVPASIAPSRPASAGPYQQYAAGSAGGSSSSAYALHVMSRGIASPPTPNAPFSGGSRVQPRHLSPSRPSGGGGGVTRPPQVLSVTTTAAASSARPYSVVMLDAIASKIQAGAGS